MVLREIQILLGLETATNYSNALFAIHIFIFVQAYIGILYVSGAVAMYLNLQETSLLRSYLSNLQRNSFSINSLRFLSTQ